MIAHHTMASLRNYSHARVQSRKHHNKNQLAATKSLNCMRHMPCHVMPPTAAAACVGDTRESITLLCQIGRSLHSRRYTFAVTRLPAPPGPQFALMPPWRTGGA